jgi:hypothetical protein
VRSLEAVVGQRSGVTTLVDREAALAAELAGLQDRYTEEHPDVVRLKRQLASVRDELLAAGGAGQTAPGGNLVRNPAFVQLKAQLNSVSTEIASVEQQREELKAQRVELQQRLARAPAVERKLNRLSRELDNAIADRDILADKATTAELSRSLESEAVGERLVLGEPPTHPEAPISPNKKLLLAIGLVLSMGSGGVSALLAEMFDRRIRGAGDLARIVGDSPLAAIPVIVTTAERRRRWTRRAVGAVAVLGVAGAGTVWVHRTVVPLDVLSFQLRNDLQEWWMSTFQLGADDSRIDG